MEQYASLVPGVVFEPMSCTSFSGRASSSRCLRRSSMNSRTRRSSSRSDHHHISKMLQNMAELKKIRVRGRIPGILVDKDAATYASSFAIANPGLQVAPVDADAMLSSQE